MIAKNKLIFITGLQKSGTTLLIRLLQHSGHAENPFQNEGNEFWGNVPPFSPSEIPAGNVYQRYHGDRGHEIGSDDATDEVRQILKKRLDCLPVQQPVILNKNPYNTVRLPWLRKLFPDAFIVAMIRRPAPNVFSLLKKYIPHKGSGLAPENGWWGVKPTGWRELSHEDKIIQCARQWQAVYAKLWQDRKLVDLIVDYRELCTCPEAVVRNIFSQIMNEPIRLSLEYPPLTCFDDEYKTGSMLRSKNRYYGRTGSLITPHEEIVEIQPFTKNDIIIIKGICEDTAGLFGLSS